MNPSPEYEWLSDPTVAGIFRHFPLAIAMLDRDSSVMALNEAFDRRYDRACLSMPAIARVVRAPGGPWQSVRLARRQGQAMDVHAQALRVEDRVMLVIDDTPGTVSHEEIERLQDRINELERLSATDRLTGAWNRAHLDYVIDTEIGRSLRQRQPLSLILLDIDHFKRVNDDFGHAAGDAVLQQLVGTVAANTRAADMLFRWGGEEFVVLATGTGHRGAEKLAETLRRTIADQAFPTVGTVTVSAGVAEHLATESAETWFRRVDVALYAAKAAGRNRVHVDRRGSSDVWAQERGGATLRLEWLEAYACGEPTIDGEHRELFALANALIAASLADGPDRAPLLEALDTLIRHIGTHFAHEEALLARHRYAGHDAHVRAHRQLSRRALELRAAAQAGASTLGDVVDFLARDVVARHLFTADREFFPLFASPAAPTAPAPA